MDLSLTLKRKFLVCRTHSGNWRGCRPFPKQTGLRDTVQCSGKPQTCFPTDRAWGGADGGEETELDSFPTVVREQEQMLLETLQMTPDEVVGGSLKHLCLTTLAASRLEACPLQSH